MNQESAVQYRKVVVNRTAEASWGVATRLKYPTGIFSHLSNTDEETQIRKMECDLMGCTLHRDRE